MDEEVTLAPASAQAAKSRVSVAEGDEGKKRKLKSAVSHGSGMAKDIHIFQKN